MTSSPDPQDPSQQPHQGAPTGQNTPDQHTSPYGTDPYRSPGYTGHGATPPYGGGHGSPGPGAEAGAGTPGGYGNQGYGNPGYGTGSYGGSSYGSSPYGASPYGTSSYGTSSYGAGWDAPASTVSSPAPKRGGTGRTVLIAAVVAVVVGGGVGAGAAALVSDNSSGSSAGLAQSTQAAPAAKLDGSVASAASAISPSVVTLSVASGQSGGTGSGIVIKNDGGTGYVLTNNHVVTLDSQTQASSNQITVTLPDGSTKDATVVGTDPADDLAVVKVEASGLKAATFSSSSKLQVGQTVVAMGAPLGLSNTVTSGIVSALSRPVATGDGNDASIFNAIQTDAAINPGNSGGPLVDLNGNVVGINSAIAGTGDSSSGTQSGNIGIGFAIPSDEAERIANELITTGKATHAVLGITVNGAQQQSGPTSGAGAKVGTVQSGSPAQKAGIKSGDVITKIGGQRIDDSIGAIAATRSYAPGTTVPVIVSSGGQTKTVNVTLGSSTDN
ncbi:S1C family serine protease [Jatrophihabitans sp. YIM 134969]